ncbi:MAG: hypothetical protein J5794_08145 [Lachnospiraceae bacterium]|nr:hypothetical protein [Lachnospiraceae bacterium]
MDKSQEFWEKNLSSVKELQGEDLIAAVKAFLDGDEEQKALVFEGLQNRIYEAASAFESEKILKMDLFQEGSLALWEFLSAYDRDPESFESEALAAVREAMQKYAAEEEESFEAGEALKAKLNVIDEICVRFAEKNDREPTAAEIAELMQTDEDEIRYLMRIALNALEKEQ